MDHLIGRFLNRLDALGIDDDAVIVIAADHGVRYRAEGPRRDPSGSSLTVNDANIVKVPLMLKLSGQSERGTVDRPVETTDVLPALLHALGIELRAGLDGVNALSDESPCASYRVVGRRGLTAEHRLDILSPDYSAPWMANDDGRVRGVSFPSPYTELLGQRVSKISRRPGSSNRIARIVRPESNDGHLVPVEGVLFPDSERVGSWLALESNGRITNVVPMVCEDPYRRAFGALAPAPDRIYEIFPAEGRSPALSDVTPNRRAFDRQGDSLVDASNGKEFRLRGDCVTGTVRKVNVAFGLASIRGTAAPRDGYAKHVLLYGDGQLIASDDVFRLGLFNLTIDSDAMERVAGCDDLELIVVGNAGCGGPIDLGGGEERLLRVARDAVRAIN